MYNNTGKNFLMCYMITNALTYMRSCSNACAYVLYIYINNDYLNIQYKFKSLWMFKVQLMLVNAFIFDIVRFKKINKKLKRKT